jgi:FixJ family two-component response regulator
MHSGHQRAIGVVDDDDAVRDSLRFLLEIAGFNVAAYGSADQFMSEAKPAELACLVIDQHMPATTGLQLIQALRSQGTDLPIALITGSPSPDLLRRAHELGVTTVLEKPLSDDVLLQFIERAAA